jgi:hypothetical protein
MRNLTTRSHIFGGVDNDDTFRSTPERRTVTLGKLNEIWNVTAIRNQTPESLKRKYDLLNSERVIVVVI